MHTDAGRERQRRADRGQEGLTEAAVLPKVSGVQAAADAPLQHLQAVGCRIRPPVRRRGPLTPPDRSSPRLTLPPSPTAHPRPFTLCGRTAAFSGWTTTVCHLSRRVAPWRPNLIASHPSHARRRVGEQLRRLLQLRPLLPVPGLRDPHCPVRPHRPAGAPHAHRVQGRRPRPRTSLAHMRTPVMPSRARPANLAVHCLVCRRHCSKRRCST